METMKIKMLKHPDFILSEDGKVYYSYDEVIDKNTKVKYVKSGTVKKDDFDNFMKNYINEGKEILYIYSIDNEYVRCAVI